MKRTLVAAFAVLIMFLPVALQAQSQARITQPIDSSSLVRIPHSTHPLARPANDRGRADANLPMDRMVLVLKPSEQQMAAMGKMIDAQHNPDSRSFHKWMTPEEFGAKFGPADEDIAKVTGWLLQQGFQVNAVGRGKQFLEFSGNAIQVENAFHTEMHRYSINGKEHLANSTDIAVPQALTPVIAGVLSLHDFKKRAAHGKTFQVHRDPATGKLVPDFTLSTQTGFAHFTAPGDFARIYNTQPLLDQKINGAGVSIAVMGRTNIELSDVQAFRKIFGLPAKDPIFIFNGGDPGIIPGEDLEATLDVEWSGVAAPNATIDFVTSPSTLTADGIDLSMMYTIDNVVAPIMSASFSLCEPALGTVGNAFFSNLYEQAAAEGITVVVSTDDTGPAGCDPQVSLGPTHFPAVSGLASTPFNLAVGGTQFAEDGLDGNYWNANNRPDQSSAIGYIPETVWDESCDPTTDPNRCFGTGNFFLVAGGGGPSSCVQSAVVNNQFVCQAGYPKPSWQAGVGVPNDGVRDLPDLALNAGGAHDGTLMCVEGSCQTIQSNGQTILQSASVVGGTSVSAPSMAGMMALIEQKNGTFQGVANFNFYKLAAKDDLTGCDSTNMTNPLKADNCNFRDVTQGSNAVPGLPGYPAQTGYDMSTGLGSVNAANVVAGWNVVSKLASVTQLSSGPITVKHGTAIPIKVTVTPKSGTGAPSGDIDLITDKSASVFAGTLTNGNLASTVANLPGGSYAVRAHYSGDAMFKSSDSTSVAVNITPETTKIFVQGVMIAPSGRIIPLAGSVAYGQPVGFEIQIVGKSGNGSATGTVTVADGGMVLGVFPVTLGHSFVEVDGLPESTGMLTGSHSFTFSYSGDASFNPVTSAAKTVRVVRKFTQTDIAPVQTTVTAGAPVEVVLIVRPDAIGPFPAGVELPTGTVRLLDNMKPISPPLPITMGGPAGHNLPQTVFTTTFSTVREHRLTVSYSGDANYRASSGVLGLVATEESVFVNAATLPVPKVALTQSPGVITIGQSANYVATVSPAVPGGPTPTGTVTLMVPMNNALDGPIALNNGNASFIETFAGARTLLASANYSGDANYAPFNSPIQTLLVNRGTPTITVKPAAKVVKANTQTSITVHVVGAPNDPIISLVPGPFGLVQFFDSVNGGAAQPLAFAEPLAGDTAGNPIFTLPIALPTGTNVITVKYFGNINWFGGTSAPVTVTVQ